MVSLSGYDVLINNVCFWQVSTPPSTWSADLLGLGTPTQTTAPPIGGDGGFLVDVFDQLSNTNQNLNSTSNGVDATALTMGAEEGFKK